MLDISEISKLLYNPPGPEVKDMTDKCGGSALSRGLRQ